MSNDIFEAQSYEPFEPIDPSPGFSTPDPFSIPRADLSYGSAETTVTPTPSLAPLAVPALAAVASTLGSSKTPNAENTTGTETNNDPVVPAKAEGRNPHARRRAIALGVLVALGFMYSNGDVTLPSSIPSMGLSQAVTPGQPSDAVIARATGTLTSMINQAAQIKAQTGTFHGIAFPADVQVMRSNNMLVLSTVIDGSCWYAALIPGFSPVPRWDPTAVRCSLDRGKTLIAP